MDNYKRKSTDNKHKPKKKPQQPKRVKHVPSEHNNILRRPAGTPTPQTQVHSQAAHTPPKPAEPTESYEKDNVIQLDEARRKKPPKRKINSGALTLIILLVVAILFLAGPMIIKTISGTMSSTQVLKSGTIEDSLNTKAIIIRNESVITSNITGTCISNYKEGEWVSKKSKVATVINSNSAELIEQMKSLNIRISRAKEDAIISNDDFKNEEIKNINNSIKDSIKDFSNIYLGDNLLQYNQIVDNINILIEQKEDLKNIDTSSTSSYLDQLIADRKEIENALKGKMVNLENDNPGTVSYLIDGFEREYSLYTLQNLSYPLLNKMIADVESGKKTKAENEYAKIINDNNYYLVCSIKYEDLDGLSSSNDINIRINEKNIIIPMRVETIAKDGDNALITFKSDRSLSEMTSMRLVNIDIIKNKITGLKVPVSAIMNKNYIQNTGTIAVIKSRYVYYVDAKILIRKGDYAIIENRDPAAEITFGLNDFIIINPGKVDEGQLVG